MGGQLLESSQENNVERTRAEEQSSHSPKQICCLVEMKLQSKEPMHSFLGWNISNGTLQTNWKPEMQVLQAKEVTGEESMNTRRFQILLQVTN